MNIGTWFEIPVKDLKRAKTFYEKATKLSLTFMAMGPSQMEMFPGGPTDPGAAGGRTLVEKMSIGGFGFIAQFQDSEGNRVGSHATS